MLHDHTKYIDIDCHLVQDNLTKEVIYILFTLSEQFADILTNVTSPTIIFNLYNKLGMIDIYVPT